MDNRGNNFINWINCYYGYYTRFRFFVGKVIESLEDRERRVICKYNNGRRNGKADVDFNLVSSKGYLGKDMDIFRNVLFVRSVSKRVKLADIFVVQLF